MVPGCSALYAYGAEEMEIFKPKSPADERGGRANDDEFNQEEQQKAEQLRLERERERQENIKESFYDDDDINSKIEDFDQNGVPIDVSRRNTLVTEYQLEAIERSCTDMKFTRKQSVEGLAGKKAEGFAHRIVEVVNAEIQLISSEVSDSKELINQNKKDRIKVKLLMDQATALGKEIDTLLTDGATRKDVFGRRLQKDMDTINEKLKELEKVRNTLHLMIRNLEIA